MELMVFDASDLHYGTQVALRTNLAVNIAHLGINWILSKPTETI